MSVHVLRNIQKKHWDCSSIIVRGFRPLLKSLNAASNLIVYHSNCPILYKPTKAIGDQITCKGMKSRVKLHTRSAPKYCLLCWQEKNGLFVDPSCQKAREWNRDHGTAMRQRAPVLTHNVIMCVFEHASRQVTSLTHRVSSVSSNSASIQKPKFAVGTVTQHLQWAGQEPVVQRGVPFTPSIRTLGQRAKDLECYRGIGTGYSGTERLVRKAGDQRHEVCCIQKTSTECCCHSAVIHQIK